jgi:hypothetical protein
MKNQMENITRQIPFDLATSKLMGEENSPPKRRDKLYGSYSQQSKQRNSMQQTTQ